MTALFSTAETFTATSALGAFLNNAPAELVVLSLAEPRPGVRAGLDATISAAMLLKPSGGAVAAYAHADMTYSSEMTPAAGGMAIMEEAEWALELTPFALSAGGMAAVVTDVLVLDYPPTAAFSTATLEWTERLIRVPHEVNIHIDMAGIGGMSVEVGGNIQTIPNDHGPVVRARAVQAQIVMS